MKVAAIRAFLESTVALELVAYIIECPSLEEDIRHSTFGIKAAGYIPSDSAHSPCWDTLNMNC